MISSPLYLSTFVCWGEGGGGAGRHAYTRTVFQVLLTPIGVSVALAPAPVSAPVSCPPGFEATFSADFLCCVCCRRSSVVSLCCRIRHTSKGVFQHLEQKKSSASVPKKKQTTRNPSSVPLDCHSREMTHAHTVCDALCVLTDITTYIYVL